MHRYILSTFFLLSLSTFAATVDLIRGGQPTADIVISRTSPPSVVTAANELQRHLEKISGAKLPLVTKPSATFPNHVYVGESECTRKLGVSLDDVEHDGFKIVARKNYVVLAGKEFDLAGRYFSQLRDTSTKSWQENWEKFCGRKWRRPGFYDYRADNKELGFYLYDGTGSIYAVYELLRQLGMRWYMPVDEIGIVYPKLKDVTIAEQTIEREPEFPQRIMTDGVGFFREEFLWYKSMGVGTSFVMPIIHSIGRLMELYRDEQPREYYGIVNGKPNDYSPKLSSAVLRRDFLEYLDAADRAYPLPYACIGQPDGWTVMDSEDAAAGWDKLAERGQRGRFSDYAWDFILDIRKRYMEQRPDRKFTVFAYGFTRRPPTMIDKIPENVAVVFCQTSNRWMLPNEELANRDEWLERLGNKEQLLIWEYYHQHAWRYKRPPVPMIFTKIMQQNFNGLYDRCVGFTTEVGWTSSEERVRTKRVTPCIGITHLMLYLHNRLCWDRDLDVQALFDEYYDLFFGPAAAEMKAFYEFAEEVWTRPESRQITTAGGFLKENDVDRYFDLLDRAKARAGDTVYGKRIDFIASEIEPLKLVHKKLERTGPTVYGFNAEGKPALDGDMTKPFWRNLPHSFYPLRDMITGEQPKHIRTNVSFRWSEAGKNSSLIVGITCMEPMMEKLCASCKDRDSMAIFSDDNVEIRIETPNGVRPVIVLNPNGVVNDRCVTDNLQDLPHFYTFGEAVIRKYADRWTVEARIDAKTISADTPTRHYPWGVNICRQRMAGNTPEHYMLGPSGSSFKDMTCMGNLAIWK